MSMELLRIIAGVKLPFTIADRVMIDGLRMLDAAGYVNAFIPAVHVDCDDCARQDPATVFEITPRGREALSRAIEQELEATKLQRPARPPPQEEPSPRAHLAWWRSGTRRRSDG